MRVTEFIREKFMSHTGKDVLWTLLGQLSVMLCLLVINKILSNSLTVDEFGQYNMIKRGASVLSFVMLGGMGIALPRYLSFYLGGQKKTEARTFVLASILYIIMVVTIVFVACCCFHKRISTLIIGEENPTSLLIVILYAYSMTYASYIYAYLRGLDRFKEFNIVQTVYQLLMLLPLLGYACFSTIDYFSLWGIVGLMLCTLWSIREIKKGRWALFKGIRRKRLAKEMMIVAKYSPMRLIGDFFLFSLAAFPVLYIGHCMSAVSVAFFSVGLTFVTMVNPVFSFLGVILLPYVSRCVANKNFNHANIFIGNLLTVELAIALSLVMILWIIMPFMVNLFFSAKYMAAVPIARIIVLSIIPNMVYLLYRNPIDAVSVIPYNTIILMLSFVLLVSLFAMSTSLYEMSWAMVIVAFFEGGCSFAVWQYLKLKNR